MTAEVAVLNASAVALAADSAVTVTPGGKSYRAQKLFELTRLYPVGIMIFNNVRLYEIPWQTLIVSYRDSPGASGKPTLHQYLEDFLHYVETTMSHGNQRLTQRTIIELARTIFANIRKGFDKVLNSIPDDQTQSSKSEEAHELDRAVEEMAKLVSEVPVVPSLEGIDAKAVVDKFRGDIDTVIDRVLDDLPVSDSARTKLHDLLPFALLGAAPWMNYTGIVVAGFGERELIPSLRSVCVYGMIEGKLKYKFGPDYSGRHAAVIPFAQSNMVDRFMTGLDPILDTYLQNSVKQSLEEFGDWLLGSAGLGEFKDYLITRGIGIRVHQFLSRMRRYQAEQFTEPITRILRFLPGSELGTLAETLVNLTAADHRFSRDQETVGGPADVAVISKGDGFVWIRRKRYFDPELNPGLDTRQRLAALGHFGAIHDRSFNPGRGHGTL